MWEQLLDMFQKADRSVEIYDGMLERGVEEAKELGTNPDTVFGAIITNTCGIVFDVLKRNMSVLKNKRPYLREYEEYLELKNSSEEDQSVYD